MSPPSRESSTPSVKGRWSRQGNFFPHDFVISLIGMYLLPACCDTYVCIWSHPATQRHNHEIVMTTCTLNIYIYVFTVVPFVSVINYTLVLMCIYIYVGERYWGHMMFPSISKSCQVQVFNTMEGRPLVPYQAVVRSSQWLAVKTRFEAAWKVHKVRGGRNFLFKKKTNRTFQEVGVEINQFFWWWGTLQLGVVILLDPKKKTFKQFSVVKSEGDKELPYWTC